MLLVTGGNGFIATSLRRSLTEADVPFKLAARQTSPNMIAVGDISSTTDWSGAVSGITTVIHLAGLAHRLSGLASLEEFRSVNVDGSINLARQAADAGVRRFVFVSSIGVLGQVTPVGQPLTDTSPARPITPYAVSKHEAEEALKTLCPTLGLELVILRPPLVYGAQAPGNFGRLVHLVRSGYPLPLVSVRNRRSMVSVGSLSRALIACATKDEAANQTFVVADEAPISTVGVVKAIAKGIGTKERLFPFPVSMLNLVLKATGRSAIADGLLASLEVDSSRLASTLAWQPEPDTGRAIVAQLTACSGTSDGSDQPLPPCDR